MKYDFIDNNSNKLVIIFNPMQGLPNRETLIKEKLRETINDRNAFYRIIKNRQFNYLFLKDNYSDLYGWYITDYDNLVFDSINEWITCFIKDGNYETENVTTFGFSKGGSAALFYSIYNENIGNCYSGTPQIDFLDFFNKSGSEVIRDMIPYGEKMNTIVFRPEKLTVTNVQIITGINDEQYSNQINYGNFLEQNLPKGSNISYNIDINGYSHASIVILNLDTVIQNFYLFAKTAQSYKISDSFMFYYLSDDICKNYNKFKENITLENNDLIIYDTKSSQLTFYTDKNVTQILCIHDGTVGMKISEKIHLLNYDLKNLKFLELKYYYVNREKIVHKNVSNFIYK